MQKKQNKQTVQNIKIKKQADLQQATSKGNLTPCHLCLCTFTPLSPLTPFDVFKYWWYI